MTGDRDPILVVVEAIAAVEGVQAHELEYALHDHVHTESIRGLLDGGYADWTLTFQVPGHEVRLRAGDGVYVDGTRVRRLDGDRVGSGDE